MGILNERFAGDLDALRHAAEQGDVEAQMLLAGIYEEGELLPQDYTQAALWFRRAAEQGDSHAQYTLGWIYEQGRGLPRDDMQAAEWYHRAAGQGVAYAQLALADMYATGCGVLQNGVQAAVWLDRALSHEDETLLLILAWDCQSAQGEGGRGGRQSDAWAAKFFRKSAENGNTFAQYSLGKLYEEGCGLPQDFSQAAVWYRRAAEQGEAKAQFSLGALYEAGRGIPQDFLLAAEWYSLAAAPGLEEQTAWQARMALLRLRTPFRRSLLALLKRIVNRAQGRLQG